MPGPTITQENSTIQSKRIINTCWFATSSPQVWLRLFIDRSFVFLFRATMRCVELRHNLASTWINKTVQCKFILLFHIMALDDAYLSHYCKMATCNFSFIGTHLGYKERPFSRSPLEGLIALQVGITPVVPVLFMSTIQSLYIMPESPLRLRRNVSTNFLRRYHYLVSYCSLFMTH